MRAADDDAVIEMDAGVPMAPPAPAPLPVAPPAPVPMAPPAAAALPMGPPAPVPIGAAFSKHDSMVLNTLPDDRIAALQTFLEDSGCSLFNAELIYRATQDGFMGKDWWRLCGGKSNTLTLVRVEGNEFVFGAFAPFQWPAKRAIKSKNIPDPSDETFLFSLVNAHNRAVKLGFKEDHIAGRRVGMYGPIFGNEDIGLMFRGRAAELNTNWIRPTSFDFDSVADGGPPIAFDKNLLAGDDGKNEEFVYFAAAEIETWQL